MSTPPIAVLGSGRVSLTAVRELRWRGREPRIMRAHALTTGDT